MEKSGLYVCNLCKKNKELEEVFKVPAGDIGAAIIAEHLLVEHGIRTLEDLYQRHIRG